MPHVARSCIISAFIGHLFLINLILDTIKVYGRRAFHVNYNIIYTVQINLRTSIFRVIGLNIIVYNISLLVHTVMVPVVCLRLW